MTMEFTKFDRTTELLHDIQYTPFWRDGCEHCKHDPTAYLFSFISREFHNGKVIQEKLDIYAFDSPIFAQEFCLRYGDEDSYYYSPGNIASILSHKHEPYRTLSELLSKSGKIRWTRNE